MLKVLICLYMCVLICLYMCVLICLYMCVLIYAQLEKEEEKEVLKVLAEETEAQKLVGDSRRIHLNTVCTRNDTHTHARVYTDIVCIRLI